MQQQPNQIFGCLVLRARLPGAGWQARLIAPRSGASLRLGQGTQHEIKGGADEAEGLDDRRFGRRAGRDPGLGFGVAQRPESANRECAGPCHDRGWLDPTGGCSRCGVWDLYRGDFPGRQARQGPDQGVQRRCGRVVDVLRLLGAVQWRNGSDRLHLYFGQLNPGNTFSVVNAKYNSQVQGGFTAKHATTVQLSIQGSAASGSFSNSAVIVKGGTTITHCATGRLTFTAYTPGAAPQGVRLINNAGLSAGQVSNFKNAISQLINNGVHQYWHTGPMTWTTNPDARTITFYNSPAPVAAICGPHAAGCHGIRNGYRGRSLTRNTRPSGRIWSVAGSHEMVEMWEDPNGQNIRPVQGTTRRILADRDRRSGRGLLPSA